eukprot:TRINITY_DN12252_c1_g3_i2.p1 TRINITY_DN12252_c1_g3~~TRINITY_DN12252_c1_g3_i2.p1  ORF type:complete len:388 (+),score=32.04 TRINITY_DN12252_c1_g3_i2:743-1906(+)
MKRISLTSRRRSCTRRPSPFGALFHYLSWVCVSHRWLVCCWVSLLASCRRRRSTDFGVIFEPFFFLSLILLLIVMEKGCLKLFRWLSHIFVILATSCCVSMAMGPPLAFEDCAFFWANVFFIFSLPWLVPALCEFILGEREAIRNDYVELTNGFRGCVEHAACSSDVDRARIYAEIEDSFAEVNTAVGILLKAGMLTPGLLVAAENGVDIEGLGTFRYFHACLVICAWCFPLLHIVSLSWYTPLDETSREFLKYLPLFQISSAFAYCVLVAIAPRENRAFAFRLLAKLLPPNLVVVEIFLIVPSSPVFWAVLLSTTCLVMSSQWRIEQVSITPCIGPFLAQPASWYYISGCVTVFVIFYGPFLSQVIVDYRAWGSMLPCFWFDVGCD